VVKQVFPIYDLIRVSHKVFEKAEFFQCERHFFAVPHDTTLAGIEFEVADLERLRERFSRSVCA
jgi:hypothetical protein